MAENLKDTVALLTEEVRKLRQRLAKRAAEDARRFEKLLRVHKATKTLLGVLLKRESHGKLPRVFSVADMHANVELHKLDVAVHITPRGVLAVLSDTKRPITPGINVASICGCSQCSPVGYAVAGSTTREVQVIEARIPSGD